jgi:bifunctional UDP-N-acetylglucosamine pyrophosphorylase/glucosamine-1-phosphate N-acetyltransferase
MVKEGTKMKVISYDGPWYTIKYPWNILDVAEYFLNKIEKSEISKSSYISNKAVVVGKVVIEEGVKVLENAVINGPCYIGKNTVIGNNSLVRNFSHIGNNCIVGYSTEIKHSYISNNCLFHSNYIGDSVIADNCLFGDRSLTANVRLDKRSVKVMINNSSIDTRRDKFGAIVGENSSIGVGGLLMPGVKVGPSSVVGPGVILYNDLEPNSMITLKQDYQIKKIKKLN